MKSIDKHLTETSSVPYIIHKHHPRSGSLHFDLRFLSPTNKKLLYSFACPKTFLTTVSTKTVVVKTRDHDPRWLILKSYRLETIEEGEVSVLKENEKKYFYLDFKGEIINGKYHLMILKNSKRDDYWLLIKDKKDA